MKIRRASTEDHPALTHLAHEAKRHWGYPEHWLKHWENDLTITPEYIEANQVFVAEDDVRIIGFYSIVMSGEKGELDHMWVDPERMGSGVGKALFVHAMRTAAGRDLSEIEILSDPNAEGFYKKMGAYRTGEDVSEIDGKPRVLPRLTVNPTSS